MKTRPAILIATLFTITNAISLKNQNPPRLSVLYDRSGQSPCTLEEHVKATCARPTDPNVPPMSLYPPVLPCTCNVVFFNLWSACLLSEGQPKLPTFDQWSQNCSASSYDINNSFDTVQHPSWADLAKPNPTNFTFDVGAAIMRAQASKGTPWTPLQIITPILSVLATLAFLGCWYLYWNSRQRPSAIWSGRPQFFRRARRVRERSRSEAWTIDLPEDPDYQSDARPGKASMSYDVPISKRDVHPPPGRHMSDTWRDPLSVVKSLRTQFLSLGQMTVVRNVTPGKGWRVSSVDHSTESSALSPKSGITRAAPNLSHPIFEDEGEDIELNGLDDADNGDETDQLISPSERSENTVFLISHQPGVDFTVESSASSHISRSVTRAMSATSMATQNGAALSPLRSSHLSSLKDQDSSIRSKLQKPTRTPFPHLPILRISMPSKLTRNHSNEQSSSVSDVNETDTFLINPRRRSPSRQASPYSDLLPTPPSPSRINSRSPKLADRHQRVPSREEAYSTRTPTPHRRTQSNGDPQSDPTMLFPWSVRGAGYSVSPSSSASIPLYDHRRTPSS